MTLSELIAARLREVRNYHGFTLKDMSERTGIVASSIGKYERGELRITVEYLEAFCRVTNHPVESLFRDATELTKPRKG